MELGKGLYETAVSNTHILSQSWTVTIWPAGAAYMPRRDDVFQCEGIFTMCSTDLDVYLLAALARLRVRTLSKNLARVAQDLRAAITAREQADQESVSGAYEDLIREAIALDADAVAFLASEWWTDITDRLRADTEYPPALVPQGH
ncbi:hypothetical protein [Actinomyces oricola]|uniref:hypothetical protein n=1 Tax=Actinomyces oricola TaxID=206043 RepID=UPI000FFF2C44|nr:hypothetical protein [Actinomyces oricola]